MKTTDRMHEDLQAARKNHDQRTVETLQSMLTRITNAEAVPVSLKNINTNGVGATEVPRKILSAQEVQALIRKELDELAEAHASMAAHPDHPYTTELSQKIAILSRYTAA